MLALRLLLLLGAGMTAADRLFERPMWVTSSRSPMLIKPPSDGVSTPVAATHRLRAGGRGGATPGAGGVFNQALTKMSVLAVAKATRVLFYVVLRVAVGQNLRSKYARANTLVVEKESSLELIALTLAVWAALMPMHEMTQVKGIKSTVAHVLGFHENSGLPFAVAMGALCAGGSTTMLRNALPASRKQALKELHKALAAPAVPLLSAAVCAYTYPQLRHKRHLDVVIDGFFGWVFAYQLAYHCVNAGCLLPVIVLHSICGGLGALYLGTQACRQALAFSA
ncbi:hypothetical protein JKP88DRAFT_330402 [Tribonema minus]|uniref:Uncharacterized protein n=1 Tax=Tribonema minus TaxID=303371 RepID=A0A835YR51_9STRA|nr:hypothetical protein JKP88DRAFT_330402 [Tribonema minus]